MVAMSESWVYDVSNSGRHTEVLTEALRHFAQSFRTLAGIAPHIGSVSLTSLHLLCRSLLVLLIIVVPFDATQSELLTALANSLGTLSAPGPRPVGHCLHCKGTSRFHLSLMP